MSAKNPNLCSCGLVWIGPSVAVPGGYASFTTTDSAGQVMHRAATCERVQPDAPVVDETRNELARFMAIGEPQSNVCEDCGEPGHRAGAMGCPCPQDAPHDQLDNPSPWWAER